MNNHIFDMMINVFGKISVMQLLGQLAISCFVAASLSFGLVGCSSNQPTDEIEYVVNANSPKTTEVQKEINQMLNVLGVFLATLQKKIVEKDGIVKEFSFDSFDILGDSSMDESSKSSTKFTFNEKMSNDQQTVYEEEIFYPDLETFRYRRRILTKAANGILQKVKHPPEKEQKPALDESDENWNIAWMGKYVLCDGKVHTYYYNPDELIYQNTIQKSKPGVLEQTNPNWSHPKIFNSVKCFIE